MPTIGEKSLIYLKSTPPSVELGLGWARAKLIASPADITPQDCTPSCVWMGTVTPDSRWKDSDYEAAFTRLSLRTAKRVLFSRPAKVEVYILIAGRNLSRNVRHAR